MPDKETFRLAVLATRPELTRKLRLNKSDGTGYSVSAKLPNGWMTYYWVDFDEDVDKAVHSFFVHVDEAKEAENPRDVWSGRSSVIEDWWDRVTRGPHG